MKSENKKQLRNSFTEHKLGTIQPDNMFNIKKYIKILQRQKFNFRDHQIACLTVATVIVLALTWIGWEWLTTTAATRESGSATIRNLLLVIGSPIALWLGFWRSKTADRKFWFDSFQQAVSMLASDQQAVRMGAIQSLKQLAVHKSEYAVQCVEVLCAYVREPRSEGNNRLAQVQPEVQEIINFLCNYQRGDRTGYKLSDIILEEELFLNLAGASLRGYSLAGAWLNCASMVGADLTGADLSGAYMSGIRLIDANLVQADLSGADMNHARLAGADLSGAQMDKTQLGGADFAGTRLTPIPDFDKFRKASKVAKITQSQLDTSILGDVIEPPELDNLKCSETDKPLVWKNKESKV